ncbi:aminoglycoside phosphotransferase family enzyme [Ciceribacter lividus]|uniref:Aminoglycoside phosphotransferase family enzyme n=1 Tax=Ciceribacter lividus TaxID=1197950 RepID=A0A6I7HRK2_9HYPH|nr:hypothetical protein [Ciceribacter lividus]RCW27323.1 aminoglycoside phosphotransferase family enzyme [Ciceribacter lividus]
MPVTIEEKLDALRKPALYGNGAADVLAVETHMSWVFLVDDEVYKIKKPVHFPFVDFTTLDARERNCREEVRLNRRLAPDVYLGTVALVRRADGSVALGGPGEVVDWLVRMRRLPQDRMLSAVLTAGGADGATADRLTRVLADFYRKAERSPLSPQEHVQCFESQQVQNRQVLSHRDFDVDMQAIRRVLNRNDECLHALRPLIEGRVADGRFVEGHGDLRPEHVCLTDPITIIDCLEFSYLLRLVDPFEEIAFLGMECAFLGVPEIGRELAARLGAALGDSVAPELYQFYSAFRATMRARMALGHLVYGPAVNRPAWERKTDRYIALAEHFLAMPELAAVSARDI